MGGTKNGGKKIKDKLTTEDPNFYRKIRAKRTSYPKHEGQFTAESAREAGSKGGAKSKRPKARKIPR